jgi:hypothetical protein
MKRKVFIISRGLYIRGATLDEEYPFPLVSKGER